MNKLIIILVGIVLFSAGSYAQNAKFNSISVGHVYNISFPDYMTRTTGLNQAASIQYMNAEKEAYSIVIDDEKEEIILAGVEIDSLNDYYDFVISGFNLDSAEIVSKQIIKINNKDAIQVDLIGTIEGAKIFYYITFIESKSHFYSIISWTLLDQKEQLINDFKKITLSFKE